MPLAMSVQVSFLLLSFIATMILAVGQGIGLTIANVSPSSNRAAFEFGTDSITLEGLACSAMAVAIPGLTQLKCTSCN